MNALLARHKGSSGSLGFSALMFLAVGNGLVYGLAIPLTAGFLVLIAPGLVPSTGRQVDGRAFVPSFCSMSASSLPCISRFRCLPSSERWGFSSAMPAA